MKRLFLKYSITSLLVLITLVAVLTGATVYFVLRGNNADTSMSPMADDGRKILYWIDPMIPNYRSDKPGKSPFMDMQLEPVYADGETNATPGMPVVSIRPEVINNLGVRTYTVTRARRPRTLTTHGYLYRTDAGGQWRAMADILDREADWLRPGLTATIRISALPGRTWPALVESLQSDIDIGARALKARVRVTVNDVALRSNMFAEITILSPPAPKQLAIPREALIRTGTRTAVVLALGGGRFQPTDVVAGAEFGDWIEIRSGLKEGDNVVVSGQFLIDSESSLRASFARIGGDTNGEGVKPNAAPSTPAGAKDAP